MEFWNALVNSLPVPANDPFAVLTSNDQLEFGSDMLVDHPFEVAAIEGPGLAVPSIVPSPNLSHHAQALSSILDSLLDATLLGQRPEATDTDVLSNREPAVNDSSNHLGQGPKRKCANDSTSKKRKLPTFAVDAKRRTDAHSDRIKVLLDYAYKLDLTTRPYIFLYVSRPETVLHPKGASKSYISGNLRKVLDDLGRDDFVNDLHAMICTFAREQQITQEQMRQINVEVNNALELR